MPHTGEPHRNNPDDTVVPRPVDYAVRALLGALLQDPQQLKTVSGLEPTHLDDSTHRFLLAAMRTLPLPDPDIHAREPVWLNAVLAAARPEAAGLTGSYLHQLIQACPRPDHAAAYAHIIMADHARRTLLAHAEQLAQTATDTTLPDPGTATLAVADTLVRILDGLASRFPSHAGSLPRTPPPPALPRDTGEDILEEERLLLAAAIAHPDDLQRMRWLHHDDFALPLHAALFQCVSPLAHRGDPVDPVTVLWEAQHRGLLTADTTADDLVALLSAPAGPPEYWGERILHRALLAQADTTARRIHHYAEDPANTPHELITGSRRALAPLHAIRARHARINHPSHPPTAPRTTPTPAVTRATTLPTTTGVTR
ncbi:DnaB-like helicase N-terminal domain-containing protein [Streptomyces sp. NPDC006923]|uniref:DnaB-like helicase N-terminal domain-containing protein n=1 Tax=Streptomyces sp. NPDC006923 TaxID=3155355 RepID=UPI0033FFFAA2